MHGIFATCWTWFKDGREVLARFGQCSQFVYNGMRCRWDQTDSRYVMVTIE